MYWDAVPNNKRMAGRRIWVDLKVSDGNIVVALFF